MPIEPQTNPSVCMPGAIVVDPLTESMNAQDFTAIAVGDCSGDWQPPGSLGGGARSADPTDTGVRLGPLHGRGADLRLPFHLEPGMSFRALDVELSYDATRLVVRSVRLLGAARAAMSSGSLSHLGVVRLALAKLEAIRSDRRPLLVVHFEAVGRRAVRDQVRVTRMKIDGVDLRQCCSERSTGVKLSRGHDGGSVAGGTVVR